MSISNVFSIFFVIWFFSIFFLCLLSTTYISFVLFLFSKKNLQEFSFLKNIHFSDSSNILIDLFVFCLFKLNLSLQIGLVECEKRNKELERKILQTFLIVNL